MTEGTPIELKDIKPGDVVRAERQDGGVLWTLTGPVRRVDESLGIALFAGTSNENECRRPWCNSTYYLLSRPEKVIDKEDLKLGQLVRIEMKDGCTYEGEVCSMFLNLPSRKRLVNLDGTPSGRNGSTCVIESIARVILLS